LIIKQTTLIYAKGLRGSTKNYPWLISDRNLLIQIQINIFVLNTFLLLIILKPNGS